MNKPRKYRAPEEDRSQLSPHVGEVVDCKGTVRVKPGKNKGKNVPRTTSKLVAEDITVSTSSGDIEIKHVSLAGEDQGAVYDKCLEHFGFTKGGHNPPKETEFEATPYKYGKDKSRLGLRLHF